MSPRPQRRAGRISSRLVLLGLLNLAGFTVVIAILIHTFQSVEAMTSAAAEGQIARAAVNAAAVRQVAGLYPLTRALTAVLSEADGRLTVAVAELRRALEGIAAGGLSRADRVTFDELSTHLTRFVSHGERVAGLRADVAAREDQALGAIARLEQALFRLRMHGARAGTGDDAPLAQRQVLLAAGREALLAAGRKRTDRPTGQPEAEGGELAADSAAVLATMGPQLADLAARPSLGEPIAAVQADLAAYLTAVHDLGEAEGILTQNLHDLRRAEMDALRLMARLDQETSDETDRFRQGILHIMFRSGVFAVTAALLVGLVMALMILVILRRQIKEPMERVIASINAISSGGFDDLKPLGGGDEWGLIQDAIENMADELSQTHGALADSKACYRSLVDNQGDLVVKLDPERRLKFVNPAFCEAVGLPEAELLGRPCLPLVYPQDPDAAGAELDLLDAPPHVCHIEQHTRTAHGWRWYAWVYRAIKGPDGSSTGAVGVGRDVTELKDAEAVVEDQRRFLRTVIDAVSDPILVITTGHRVKMANAAACRLSAWGDADGPEVAPSGCCHIITHRAEQSCSLSGETCSLEQALASGGTVRSLHRHRLDGRERYMEVSTSPYWGPDGEIEGVVEVGRDITDELAAQERVQFLAHHDVLTGLPNRVQFYERFAAAAEVAAEAKEYSRVGLLYLDLDHFKQVNDTLGHHIGDLLLQEIARRLSGVVRSTDTVSRQGGDEFLVVLPELQDGVEALGVAEKIRASLEGPIVLEGHALRVSFSIGAAILPEDGTDFDALLKHADLAMYAAKAAGRNRVRRYDPSMDRRARVRAAA